MPYSSIKDLPGHLKKYSEKVQRQYMHVFNSVYKKTGDEGRAFKAANAVLGKRFKGAKLAESNTQHDQFNILVDRFLGNLEG